MDFNWHTDEAQRSKFVAEISSRHLETVRKICYSSYGKSQTVDPDVLCQDVFLKLASGLSKGTHFCCGFEYETAINNWSPVSAIRYSFAALNRSKPPRTVPADEAKLEAAENDDTPSDSRLAEDLERLGSLYGLRFYELLAKALIPTLAPESDPELANEREHLLSYLSKALGENPFKLFMNALSTVESIKVEPQTKVTRASKARGQLADMRKSLARLAIAALVIFPALPDVTVWVGRGLVN